MLVEARPERVSIGLGLDVAHILVAASGGR